MNALQHPLISAYAARHGLPPSTRADGRLTVVVDQTYRVHLQPALWLQQSLQPGSGELALDEAMGAFTNALSFWAGAVRRLA